MGCPWGPQDLPSNVHHFPDPGSPSWPRLSSLAFQPHARPRCPLLCSLPSDSVLPLAGAHHWPPSPCFLDSLPLLLFPLPGMSLALGYSDLSHSSQRCWSPVSSGKLLLPAQPSPRLVFLLPGLRPCCPLLTSLVWWQEVHPYLLVWGSDIGEARPLWGRGVAGRPSTGCMFPRRSFQP